MTPDDRRALEPVVQDKLQVIRDHVTKFTIPLYSEVSAADRRTVVRGTGILLSVGSHRFVVTAAHVADLGAKDGLSLHFRIPGDVPAVFGVGQEIRGFSSQSKDSKHLDDPIDVGVIDLPPAHAQALESRYQFLTLGQLDPSDAAITESSGYTTTGYPSVLSGLGVTAQTVKGLILSSVRHGGDLSWFNRFNPKYHSAMDYKAEYVFDGDLEEGQELPHPGGMSGGALWRTLDHGQPVESSGPDRVRLVGIVQELLHEPPILVATQVEYLLQVILKGYPETRWVLNSYLPGWRRPGWKPRV